MRNKSASLTPLPPFPIKEGGTKSPSPSKGGVGREVKKLVTRYSLLTTIFLLLLLTLTACGNDPTPKSVTPDPSPTAQTIISSGVTAAPPAATVKPGATQTVLSTDGRLILNLWTSDWKNNPDYEKFLNGVIDDYHKLYPNVTFEWRDFGADTINRLEKAWNGTGDTKIAPPDLILLNPTDFYQYAATNRLEPLNDYSEFSSKSSGYIPAALDAYKVGSANFGLPWLATTRISLINKKLWQVAGLDLANPPRTFEELDTAMKPLVTKTPDDVRAVWLKPDPVVDFMLEDLPLFSLGPPRTAAFNNPVTQARWNFYQARLRDGSLVKEALDGNTQDILNRFANGKIAVWLDAGDSLTALKTTNADTYNQNTLVALNPTARPGILPYISKGVWSVPKTAQNKSKAVDFATFITSDQNELGFAKLLPSGIYIPTNRAALTDPFITATNEPIAQARGLIATALPNTRPPEKTLPYPLSADERGKLLTALNDAQRKMWLNNVAPAQALFDADKIWNTILK